MKADNIYQGISRKRMSLEIINVNRQKGVPYADSIDGLGLDFDFTPYRFLHRVKVKFFQHLYIPVAVIAGIIGLLLGPNVLGRVSPIYLPFSQGSGGYANILLVVVFTTLCVTAFSASVGNIAKCSFQCLCLGSVLLIGQTVVGFGLVKILQAMGSDILDGFALLPSTGFYGGHGLGATVAAGLGTVELLEYRRCYIDFYDFRHDWTFVRHYRRYCVYQRGSPQGRAERCNEN